MSIFFEGETRLPRQVDPNPTVADYETAVALLAKPDRDRVSRFQAVGLLGRDKAERLFHLCRVAEGALLAAVGDGSVTTKTQAIACVQAATLPQFPAAAFVQVIVDRYGTWTAAYAAAQAEIG